MVVTHLFFFLSFSFFFLFFFKDDDEREPEGQLFVMLGKKMISVEFYSEETINNIKNRLATEAGN